MKKLQSHYEVLGLNPDATIEQIIIAYRHLAMQWHPDKSPHAGPEELADVTEVFKDISLAKKILSDPIARAEYDAFLARSENAERTELAETFTRESSMSQAEAQQMHFADLAAFAQTLAAKGWNARAISDHLMELGCSPTMAIALAQSARDRVDWAGRDSGHGTGDAPSLDQVNWEKVRPYYRAFIGGIANQIEFTDADFDRVDALRRKRRRIAIGAAGAISLVVLAYTVLKVPSMSTGPFLGLVICIAILSLVLGFVAESIASLFIPDRSRYVGEKTIRFYLQHFERFHTKKSIRISNTFGYIESFIFGPVVWTAYRRMPVLCGIFIVAWVGMIFIIERALPKETVPGSVLSALFLAINIAFSLIAPRLYFYSARTKIRTLMAQSRRDLVGRVSMAGGTNWWSWMPAIACTFVLLIVVGAMTEATPHSTLTASSNPQPPTTATSEAPSIVAAGNATAAPTNSSEVDLQIRFDKAVRALEAKYPRLNPRSPQYDGRLVASVLQRKEALMATGMPADNALMLAVSDVVDAVNTSTPQGNSADARRRSATLPHDQSNRFTHTTSAENQQIICDSFPTSCRQ